MKLAGILDRVKRRSGQIARTRTMPDLAVTAAQDELIQGFVEDGLMRVAETGRLEGTVTVKLTTGAASYELPEDVRHVKEVHLGGALLPAMNALEAADEAADEDGEPTAWGVYGRRLYVNTTPEEDADLTLYVNFSAGYRVGSGTDVLDATPQEFEPVLVDYALGQWFAIQGAGDLAQKYLTDFETGLLRRSVKTEPSRIAQRSYRYL